MEALGVKPLRVMQMLPIGGELGFSYAIVAVPLRNSHPPSTTPSRRSIRFSIPLSSKIDIITAIYIVFCLMICAPVIAAF